MRKLFYAKLNALLGALLSLLGFSSCDLGPSLDPWNEVCLYGTPYAILEVKGKVTNESGESLQDIQVTVKTIYHYEDTEDKDFLYNLQTTGTDANGQYFHKESWNSSPHVFIRVVAEDPKGVYAADSTDLTTVRSDDGKNSWCMGTDRGEADFKLKKTQDHK